MYVFKTNHSLRRSKVGIRCWGKIILSILVLNALPFHGHLFGQSVVINSYANYNSPNDEWTELLIAEDNVDLRGWTLRDNNAAQESWQEPIIFNNIPLWNNLRRGTIIVINHRAAGSLETDNIKSDGFIRVNANDPLYFTGGFFPNNTLNIATGGDLLQLRTSGGQHVHALGHRLTTGSLYEPVPLPKLNYKGNLDTLQMLMVCPGSDITEFGTIAPQDGTTWSSKSTSKVAGLPNQCSVASSNSDFWRALRQPTWSSPSASANYNESTNQIGLTWSTLTDPNPGDGVQGYMILRNTSNSFMHPSDGFTYNVGQVIGTATVVAVLSGSGTNFYDDIYNIPCGQNMYYRIYGYRYSTDNLHNNNFHQARGRAYNETNFATAIATRTTVPAAVSISANPGGTVPSGTPVTFTPIPVNGGPSPTFTWFVNGNLVFTGSPFVYTPLNGDQVFCQMTSNAGCVANNPATSNVITMTVTPVCNPGTISGEQVMCVNTTQTFTSNGAAAGVWSSSNTAVLTIHPVSGLATALSAGMAVVKYTVSGCVGQDNATFFVTVNPHANAGSDQSHCGVLTATLSGNTPLAGAGFWSQVSGPGIATIMPNIYAPTVSVTVTEPGIYGFSWAFSEGVCSSSDQVQVQFDPLLPVSVSISPVNTNLCEGSPVSLQAIPVNGGNPSFNWYVNGLLQGSHNQSFTFTPNDGDDVYVQLTSSLSCVSGNPAASELLTFAVSPTAAVQANLSVSANNICAGTQVTFQLQTQNAGINPEIRWYKNANQVQFGGLTYNDIPSNADAYRATVTSQNACAASNPANSNLITMNVNATSMASITLSSSPSPACSNVPVTISTSVANGGGAPQYVWFLNDALWQGVNGPTHTYMPGLSDRIRVQLTSNQPCVLNSPVMSAEFIPNVMQAAIAPTDLTTDRNNYCANEGGNITLTANGGAGDQVKWYGGSCGTTLLHTGPVYTLPAPTISTSFFARWETAGCGVSACQMITINVLPAITPTISIAASTNNICADENVVFTASSSGTGPAPQYQWKVNGNIVQSSTSNIFSSNTLQNSDLVVCTLLSDNACSAVASVNSNEIVITVMPLVFPEVQIAGSQTSACSGLPVDFSIVASSGGGSTPQYQWFKDGSAVPGQNGITYSTSFAINGTVSCQMTSSANCVAQPIVQSNTISITVSPTVTPSIVIQGPVNQVSCVGQTLLFTSAITNGGTNPGYQWYVDDAVWPGAVNASFNTSALSPGSHQVYCVLYSSSPCASVSSVSSNTVSITVEQFVLPEATITAPQTDFCQGEEAHFTAVVGNQGAAPTYEWLVNGIPQMGQNTLTFNYLPSASAAVSFRLTSSVACVSENPITSNVISIVLHPNAPVAVTVAPSQNEVCAGETVQFTATPQNGGSNPLFTWYVNDVVAGSNSATFVHTPDPGDQIHVVLQSSIPFCTINNPASSEPVSPLVLPNPVAPDFATVSNPVVCQGETGSITLAASGGLGDVLRWYANDCLTGPLVGEGVSIQLPAPQVSTTYFARFETEFCGESACAAVSVVVSESIQPGIDLQLSNTQPCEGELITVTANVIGQGDAPLFEWFRNGTPIGSNQPTIQLVPANGDVLECRLTSSESCASPAQVVAGHTFNVLPAILPAVTVAASSNGVCEGTEVVFEAAAINGGPQPEFQWTVDGIPQGGNSSTFLYAPADGALVQCLLISNAQCASPTQVLSDPIVMSVFPVVTPEISISADQTSVCLNEYVHFEAAVVNQGQNPFYTWLVNGIPVGNEVTFVYQPQDQDVVQCELNASESCLSQNPVYSNNITLSVSAPLTPGVSISTPTTAVCAGSLVSVQAVVENGGTEPAYSWFVNGVLTSNAALLEFVPTNGASVYCIVSSNASCLTTPTAISETLIFTVNDVVETSITIVAPELTLCEGSMAEVVAEFEGGGTTPTFAWMLNGMQQPETGSSLTFYPQSGDLLQCSMTSSAMCASMPVSNSNELIFNILPWISPSVSLTYSNGEVCLGEQVNVQAAFTGGGSQPEFSWTLNGETIGSNQPDLVYIPANMDSLVCTLTSNAACASPSVVASVPLVIPVSDVVVPSINISGAESQICPDTEITLTAVTSGGGNQPAISWYRNGNLAGSGSSLTLMPLPAEIISCVLTSSANCAQPSMVQHSVLPQVAPAVTLSFHDVLPATCNQDNGSFAIAAEGGIAPLSFSTDNGLSWQNQFEFINQAAGSKHLLVRDAWGCFTQLPQAFFIQSIPPPEITEVILNGSRAGMAEGSAAIILDYSDGCEYSIDGANWQPEQRFERLYPGSYTAYVRDAYGCVVQKEFEIITQLVDFEPGIPNAFRPASIAGNASFKPVFGAAVPLSYHMMIFDSWGQLIFETSDYNLGWDGSREGEKMPQGVYSWVIEYELASNSSYRVFEFKRRGTVLLLD